MALNRLLDHGALDGAAFTFSSAIGLRSGNERHSIASLRAGPRALRVDDDNNTGGQRSHSLARRAAGPAKV
jgi:hypothetical protein